MERFSFTKEIKNAHKGKVTVVNMKILLGIFLIMISFPATSFSVDSPEGLLGFKFGSSIEECEKNLVNPKKSQDGNGLEGLFDRKRRKIGIVDVEGVVLKFCKNKLFLIVTFMFDENSNLGHGALSEALEKKYGKPKERKTFKDDYGTFRGFNHYWYINDITIELGYLLDKQKATLLYHDEKYLDCELPDNKKENPTEKAL